MSNKDKSRKHRVKTCQNCGTCKECLDTLDATLLAGLPHQNSPLNLVDPLLCSLTINPILSTDLPDGLPLNDNLNISTVTAHESISASSNFEQTQLPKSSSSVSNSPRGNRNKKIQNVRVEGIRSRMASNESVIANQKIQIQNISNRTISGEYLAEALKRAQFSDVQTEKPFTASSISTILNGESDSKIFPEKVLRRSSSFVKMETISAPELIEVPSLLIEVGGDSHVEIMGGSIKNVASIKDHLEYKLISSGSMKDSDLHFFPVEHLNSQKIALNKDILISTRNDRFLNLIIPPESKSKANNFDISKFPMKDFLSSPYISPISKQTFSIPQINLKLENESLSQTPFHRNRGSDIFGSARIRKNTALTDDDADGEKKEFSISNSNSNSSYGMLTQTVASRKAPSTTPISTNTSLASSDNPDTPDTPASLPSSASTEQLSPKKSTKGFKEWYAQSNPIKDTAITPQITEEESGFPEQIYLSTIFGSKSTIKDAVQRILVAAECYQKVKVASGEWQQRSTTDAIDCSSPGESFTYYTTYNIVDIEEVEIIHYRVLDIFKDGCLESLTYVPSGGDNSSEIISAGTPQALLDALIFPLGQNMAYSEIFLATYRFFLTAENLLTSLIEWYNVDADEECTSAQDLFLRKHRKYIQSRATKVLLMWVKNHWQDFVDDRKLMDGLSKFLTQISQTSFGDSQKLTQAVREQRLSWYTYQYISPFPNNRAQNTARSFALTWDSEDMANQLTLLDQFFFTQIRPHTYLRLMQSPVSYVGGAHNQALKMLLDYTAFFRTIIKFMQLTILREDGPKRRAKALKRVIKIARDCRTLRNYNTIFAIVSALKHPCISILAAIWE
ncbi:hypothetical protein HK096_008091, partial [Nowakowskiella sp. JEL0078]